MLRENRRTLIITSVVALLPMVIGVALWGKLPEEMATHIGLNGEADGYAAKWLAVFGIPLFLVALEWVCAAVTAHDPRRRNISPKLFTLVLWSVPMISVFLAAVLYPYNLGYRMDIAYVTNLFLGGMFVILGNYMPKVRQNYTIGIRIPWTLSDEGNWNKTHRLAGRVWVLGGIALIALTLMGVMRGWLMVPAILVLAAVPVVYSFGLSLKKG